MSWGDDGSLRAVLALRSLRLAAPLRVSVVRGAAVRGRVDGSGVMAGHLERLLAAKEVTIVCGSGGVGKTTTAAALGAMAATRFGARVLVVTVDPARRLATALGLEELGNVERRIASDVLAAAGFEPRGELWVAMLDTKSEWDELVRRHAPDAATRDAILANPLYDNITARFVQSHDYIAMERLYDIHVSGDYDLVVVDTPPSRHALDFLDAPARMADFFSSRLLRWLTVPYRSRFVSAASKPFMQLADRILGSQFLADIAEFFILFQTMHRGFVERAQAVQRVLADRRTTFVVVSTPEPGPLREAEFFIDALATRRLHLGALVVNRVLPDFLLEPAASTAATAIRAEASDLATVVAPLIDATPEELANLLCEMAERFHDYASAAAREAELTAELSVPTTAVVRVPFLDHDVADLASLGELAEHLWR